MRKINKKQKLIIFIAIMMVLVIIGVIVGANVIKTNIANGNYNSANNNSNSGNLLPEYIKEGITLGGVTGSLVDLDTSDATATEEDIMWGKTAYVKGKKITGAKVVPKIGNYVNYTPDSAGVYSLAASFTGYETNQTIRQESLTWQILSINKDGTIDLVGSPTQQILYLGGATGYNNGVYLLNDLCAKQYSNKKLETTARNIKIEDIESKLNKNGIDAINSFPNSNVVRTLVTYNSTYADYYPILYSRENGSGINTTTTKKDGIGISDNYYSTPTTETYLKSGGIGLTVTSMYQGLRYLNTYFDDINFCNLIIMGQNYYCASRYVTSDGTTAWFGIRSVDGSTIGGPSLYQSTNRVLSDGRQIRPVVTLNANIIIYGGDGSKEHPYQLTK